MAIGRYLGARDRRSHPRGLHRPAGRALQAPRSPGSRDRLMKRSLLPAAALVAALAVPAAASAQTVPTPTPTPTPPPPAPVPVAKAAMQLQLGKVLRDGSNRVQVTGRSFRARGTLTPYIAGQRVRVDLLRDGKVIKRLHPKVKRGKSGRSGVFAVKIKRGVAATYRLRAIHKGTKVQR